MRDDKDKAYEVYKNFDTLSKSENMSMSEYIVEFDKRYNQSKKYEITIPEAVLAFRLLDKANLTLSEKQLALTASSDIKYATMKSALLRIFGDGACANNNDQSITIKQEPVYHTQQKKPMSSQRGTNPLNKYGKRTKCAICQSVYHWAKECLNKAASNSV